MFLRNLYASAWALVVVRVIGIGLGFAVTVALSRVLGPDGYGHYALFLMLVTLLSVPLGKGWSTLVLRTVSRVANDQRWPETRALLRRGRHLSAAYALLVLLCGLLLAQSESIDLRWSTVLVVSALLIIRQNSSFRFATIRGAGHPVAAQIPELIVQPVLLVVGLIVVARTASASLDWFDAVKALLLASFITLVCGQWLQSALVQPVLSSSIRTPAPQMAEWLAAAGVIGLNGLLMTLFSQVDSYVLAAFADPSSLGVYRVAVQFAALGGFAYASLNFLAAARLNAAWSEGRLNEVEELSSRYGLLSLLFATTAAALMVVSGDAVLARVFGEEFLGAAEPILILLLGQILNAAVGMPAVLLTMAGHERRVIRTTVVALLINALAALLLVPSFGAQGAAIASTMSFTYLNISHYLIARQRLGVNMAVWRRLI